MRRASSIQRTRASPSDRRHRTAALLAILLLGIGASRSAHSQQAPAARGAAPPVVAPGSPPAVSFVIEKIVVEGARSGADRIVAAETLLQPGGTYTEQQILEGLRRVERLPFVVEATPSLRRGSTRGHFELVITIRQAWPVFLGAALAASHDHARFRGDGPANTIALDGELGARIFLGGFQELSGSLGGLAALKGEPANFYLWDFDRSRILPCASYRHHNLFRRHVLGELFVRRPPNGGLEVGAALAAPLSATSAVRSSLSAWRKEYDVCGAPCSGEESHTRDLQVTLGWQRDTTDDPFTPREGSRVEVALGRVEARGTTRYLSELALPEVSGGRLDRDFESDETEATLSARRYWPLASRLALGISVSGRAFSLEGDSTWSPPVESYPTKGDATELGGGLELSLVGTFGRQGSEPFWWTATAGVTGADHRSSSNAYPFSLHFNRGDLKVAFAVAGRGRWGIARLELSYVRGIF